MNLARRWLPLALVLAAVVAAGCWLFRLRLGNGDVYPPYSSLRADALGTRALHDALREVPGMRVERDYQPVTKLSARPKLVLLPGLIWQEWQTRPADELTALHAVAARGGRVVLAFRADLRREVRDAKGRLVPEEETLEEKRERERNEAEEERRRRRLNRLTGRRTAMIELGKAWGVTLQQRWLMAKHTGAQREPAAAGLPAEVPWKSDVHFAPSPEAGWDVIYRRAGQPVLLEKRVGAGSLVLLSDAFCLSNESVHASRTSELLSWVVGDRHDVVFLEGPLGVMEERGVGHLARRYGLHGALALSLLLGVLYVWRQGVAFVPPVDARTPEGEVALAYESAAGFTALLRRSVGPGTLLATCVAEWRRGRHRGVTPAAAARLEAVWQSRDSRQSLSNVYNALVRALKPR